MALRIKREDGLIEISLTWREARILVKLPRTSLPGLLYSLILIFLFLSLSLASLQTYVFLPVTLFILTLFVSLYFGLDYRYLIVSGLIFSVSSSLFLVAGKGPVAQGMASYSYRFLLLGLLFIAVNYFLAKVKQRGYLALFRRSCVYISLLFVVVISFFLINARYQAEVGKALGSPEPTIKVKSLLSNDLIYFMRWGEKDIRRALGKSLGPFVLQEVHSEFQEAGEENYGAAYNDNDETPLQMDPDTEYIVPIEIINIGSVAWKVGGDNLVQFSYKWSDPETGELFVREGLRTPLPRAVAPGEKVTLEAKVLSPPGFGTYMLSYQMVRAGQFWFKHAGSIPLRKIVTISPQKGVSTLPRDFLLDNNVDFVGNTANVVSAKSRLPKVAHMVF